ncbi:RelA/SpoT domain-containing protein [Idiomarina aquatica]|uniref:Addiction module component n=1 Tax=Idiomarina aquatica TaxID=1327752 RepID=A0AA94EGA7_9GAMM|nr:RelA/SpoT domain-containing protein [Idiomarina aquatica]RUO44518.1 addiction module component [Idiomarina aquatica]
MELEIDDLDVFLTRNRVSKDDWDKAAISVDELKSIATDYKKSIPHLNESAEFLAKVLQKCPQVHSVRWRVKDPEHLLEKIIRKRASGSKKYLEISEHNYFEIVTDLVGVRVLHLFKYEWLDIHSYILGCWEPMEKVKAYIREGDEGGVVDSYSENGCDVEPHLSGYRSIHYIISTKPTLKKVLSEIQVRTIFEEGWSEIDHKVRYPNFSDNKLISYFLTIFNRMAGSADEMGTFVKDLTAEIALQELKYAEVQKKHEEHLSKIEDLALELSKEKKQNKTRAENLKKLSAEISELRENTKLSEHYVSPNISGLSGLDRAALLGASASALASLDKTSLLGSSASALASLDKTSLLGSSASALASLDKTSLLGSSASALASLDKTSLLGSSASALTGFDKDSQPISKQNVKKDKDTPNDDN